MSTWSRGDAVQRKLLVTFMFICHAGETLPLSSGNKITLRFTANGTETAKGFHFVYQGKRFIYYLFIIIMIFFHCVLRPFEGDLVK